MKLLMHFFGILAIPVMIYIPIAAVPLFYKISIELMGLFVLLHSTTGLHILAKQKT